MVVFSLFKSLTNANVIKNYINNYDANNHWSRFNSWCLCAEEFNDGVVKIDDKYLVAPNNVKAGDYIIIKDGNNIRLDNGAIVIDINSDGKLVVHKFVMKSSSHSCGYSIANSARKDDIIVVDSAKIVNAGILCKKAYKALNVTPAGVDFRVVSIVNTGRCGGATQSNVHCKWRAIIEINGRVKYVDYYLDTGEALTTEVVKQNLSGGYVYDF